MKLRVKFDRVFVMGSQAFAPGSFSIDLTPKAGGNATKAIGKFIHGFKKEKDGSWKFSNLIFNWDKPPA
jgi:ketosteroid isomerase-like protein